MVAGAARVGRPPAPGGPGLSTLASWRNRTRWGTIERMGKRACIVAMVGLALGCGAEDLPGDGSDGGDEGSAPPDFFEGPPLNIAHRGGVDEFPEHTLFAYTEALAVGADVLELDVHRTSDDELVLIHDDTVDRTTDGSGGVSGMTLAELQGLDAAYHFTLDGGETFPHRGMGLTIPTLEETFAAFPDVLYAIEIKPDDELVADLLVDAIHAAGLEGQVVVVCFNQGPTDRFRELAPDIPSGLALPEILQLTAVTAETEADYVPPGRYAQLPTEVSGITVLDQELVELALRKDMLIHPWTINEPAEMEQLLDWGVHGIITDRPSTLEGILAEDF